jgi:hypothetical protein
MYSTLNGRAYILKYFLRIIIHVRVLVKRRTKTDIDKILWYMVRDGITKKKLNNDTDMSRQEVRHPIVAAGFEIFPAVKS